MKNFKKLIAAATIVGMLGVVGVAGAAAATGAKTPADIVAGLTKMSVEEVTALKANGTTYGAIAQEAGKLDEFKTENLVQKKAVLEQRVTEGSLTQDRADEIAKLIETNQETCDGTGSARIGQKAGVSFGQGPGMGGRGAGQHKGGGMGMGTGTGCSLNNN